MRIKIEEVLDVAHGWIRFRSGTESVKGCWAGPGEVPVGRELDIEMEVSEQGITSVRPAMRPFRDAVTQDGGEVVIIGCAERFADDGIIEFRVGQDIILLESVGPLAEIVECSHFELRMPELMIYPCDL
ncbi:hypothetical protein [Salinispora fenicalii]|uniref:hypothetical protein n=1 Tax=Salinispora fenicalii TaxID=1137263 RepID=UPI0012BC33AF|nr:hypothetical protein [Salinispora fenicalii]